MRRFLFFYFLGVTSFIHAQQFHGSWTGELNIGIQKLRINIHIDSVEAYVVKGSFDSPNQGVFGIAFNDVRIRNGELMCRLSEADITFHAELTGIDEMEGRWIQGGQSFGFPLRPLLEEDRKPKRTQELSLPLPYLEEAFSFINDNGDTLHGTLSIPAGRKRFPAVILITGSGPQDRNSEILGHKPFLVLSDHLTRMGIAVLRFDERGVGESGGDFERATTGDFGADVRQAYLKLLKHRRIDKKRVGLFGHSEGGWTAMIANSELQNSPPAFLIMAAASGVPAKELLLMQRDRIEKLQGLSKRQREKSAEEVTVYFDIMLEANSLEEAHTKLEGYFAVKARDYNDPEALRNEYAIISNSMLTPWFYFFLHYPVREGIHAIKSPTLVINGRLDTQVPAEENTRSFLRILQQNRVPVEVKI
ncbi:MAG: hypothetical protein EA358_00525, partial [Flavobacteriales bacterium]